MPNKVISKFGDYLETIYSAIDGTVDLRDNYKLYNKIYRYYSRTGVTFTGDVVVDYNIILNYLYEDLTA